MKRLFFWIIALVVVMFWAMTVQAQESQDSTESVNKLVALQEVVIKGGLPKPVPKTISKIRKDITFGKD